MPEDSRVSPVDDETPDRCYVIPDEDVTAPTDPAPSGGLDTWEW